MVVTISAMQCQLVVAYCQPSTRQGAAHHNAQLIHAALDAAGQLPLPTVIAGDFNGDPLTWQCGHRLKALGFVDLNHIHQRRCGKEMPPTCRESTHPDGALCCPSFAPLVSSIRILDTPYFDTHKVVLVDAAFPTEAMTYHRFHMPRTFLEHDIGRNIMEQAFRTRLQNRQPTTLQS